MRRLVVIATASSALLAAGCGEDESYSNDPRPPSAIVLTASINAEEVSISPPRLGAGPVSLVIANETSAAQEITFETSGGTAGFTQTTGPINPGDTATLKADVPPGKVVVKVRGNGIKPARLTVGPRRASARDEPLQP